MLAGLVSVRPVMVRADDTPAARRAAADAQFARAEAMRGALEAKPERERSIQEYAQLAAAYRRVYLITPRAPEVPTAIKQVADLYRHMGEQFEPKYFQSALATYRFLAHDYPTSSLRPEALLAIAEIEQKNLSENDKAQADYEDFLKQYPRSAQAADVRKTLAAMKAGSDLAAKSQAPAEATPAAASSDKSDDKSSGQLSEIGHVRVWNADNYTRIVIDLGGQTKYQAARISNPDRIYFDLDKAKLSSALAHQSIEVPEGGYLKAVRVAQNRSDAVRVVLDVTKVKDYSVFELANPDRLVVDVYGPGADLAKVKADGNAKETALETPGKPTATGPAKTTPETRSTATVANAAAAAAVASGSRTRAARVRPVKLPALPVRPLFKMVTLTPLPEPPSTRRSVRKSSPALEAKAGTTDADKGAAPVSTSERDPFAAPKGIATRGKASRSKAAAQPKPQPSPEPSAPAESAKAAAENLGPAPIPERTRSGERSLTRALGLKIGRIVIDAGHGGRDTGTIGPTGLMEKDLCLDVALRLGKLIQQRLPSTEVVYTRENDTFIPLEQRTAIANDAKADLFLSIHANSSDDHKTSGIETYYLNFNPSAQAMEVATRENATAQSSVHDLQELVTKIARNEKIEESRDFATDIQDSLAKSMQKDSHTERDRGVRRAPFVVLIGADMPSVLSEISFLSNPADEQWLKKPENRERIAEGLYRGIEGYLQSTNSLTTNLTQATPTGPRQQ